MILLLRHNVEKIIKIRTSREIIDIMLTCLFITKNSFYFFYTKKVLPPTPITMGPAYDRLLR